MSSARESIAKNIRVYRELANMTQKDLAEKLGVTKAAVNNWENGANSVDIETLMEICKLFNITPSIIADVPEDEAVLAHKYYMAYQQAPEDIKQAVDILLKRSK
jgi:transcriptional regulator with XRE-family HTH domain